MIADTRWRLGSITTFGAALAEADKCVQRRFCNRALDDQTTSLVIQLFDLEIKPTRDLVERIRRS